MERTPILFLFLDGVGLGQADESSNPFLAADLPNLTRMLEGRRLDSTLEPFHGSIASFRPIDATLGVAGSPESATGQSALLSGVNTAKAIGGHFGPKPDPRIRAVLEKHNLPARLEKAGRKARLLNAYPEAYFEAIRSGRRLHAAIPLAFTLAGITLSTETDLDRGEAVSADFTGRGWRTRLRRSDTPTLSPKQAGQRMAELALSNDFTMFDHWPPDYAGHYGEMRGAIRLLEVLDGALGGILEVVQKTNLTVMLTSDHGNLEDLTIRGHTRNPVPALIMGFPAARKQIAERLSDLTDFVPAILMFFGLRA